MKKKFIYRKLELDDKVYYQMYKIVNIDEMNEITNQKPGEDNEYLYREVDSDEDTVLNDFLYTIYEENNGELEFLKDSVLITKLHQMFYDKYQDFNILAKNTLDVDKVNELINKDIMFQEKAVSELLNVIKSNLDIAVSSLDNNKKRRLINNIIIYGPKGFGKTSTIDKILQNSGVPSLAMKITMDSNENIQSLVHMLSNAAMGNMKIAENSIVFIEDNFDELMMELNEEGDYDTNPFVFLDELLKNQYIALGKDKELVFDMSKITFVLVKNTSSNDANNLYDEGLTESLYKQFKTVICFGKLSKEEIKEVILTSKNSVLKAYQELIDDCGKKLIIEDDFLDTLIDRAYYDVGGIELINNYIELMIKTRWNNDVIILNKELVLETVEDSSYLKNDVLKEDEVNEELNNTAKEVKKNNQSKKENNPKKENSEDKKEFVIDLSTAKDEYRQMLFSIMEYVKGQDEPLKNLLFHSYINDKVQNSSLDPDMKKDRIDHMLIRGGAGTGKSFITGLIAKHLNNKPYAVIDCKRYTEAGYVGKSVDDMLIQLYYAAECDLEKAENGILILDEIDKLSRNNGDRVGVSRGGVQESLLKLMEGTIFDLEIKEGGFTKTINFDTRSLMIICAGAFEGLDKIKEQRLKKGNKKTIGFQTVTETKDKFIDQNYTIADMQEFGMDAQLLRRINYHCDLNKLTKEDYKNIMLNSKSSAFLIKLERINMLGVEVVYDDEFIDLFSEKVSKLGFGVSGIAILIDRIFSNFESKIMLGNYNKVILNKECIEDPSKIILEEKQDKVLKKKI